VILIKIKYGAIKSDFFNRVAEKSSQQCLIASQNYFAFLER